MSTTLMPIDPATSPQQVLRVLTITAHLLPAEIVDVRRARRTRAWVLMIVALVLVLLAGWYLYASHQKNAADAELRSHAAEAASLQTSQNKDYADVVKVQLETKTIDKQLSTAMAADLPWATLFKKLTDVGTASGVKVNGINGSLTDTADGTTENQLPSTATSIGTLTVTGTAPDKASVAKYLNQLGDIPTVSGAFLNTAAQNHKRVEYSLRVQITDVALCGQYTTACKTGGK